MYIFAVSVIIYVCVVLLQNEMAQCMS